MNQIPSTNLDANSSLITADAQIRQMERELDYNLSLVATAMDNAATKINSTVDFVQKVNDVVEYPVMAIANIKKNPEPYILNAILAVGIFSAIKTFNRDYEIVSPFNWK